MGCRFGFCLHSFSHLLTLILLLFLSFWYTLIYLLLFLLPPFRVDEERLPLFPPTLQSVGWWGSILQGPSSSGTDPPSSRTVVGDRDLAIYYMDILQMVFLDWAQSSGCQPLEAVPVSHEAGLYICCSFSHFLMSQLSIGLCCDGVPCPLQHFGGWWAPRFLFALCDAQLAYVFHSLVRFRHLIFNLINMNLVIKHPYSMCSCL